MFSAKISEGTQQNEFLIIWLRKVRYRKIAPEMLSFALLLNWCRTTAE